MPFRGKCKIIGCTETHYSHGYCESHYPFEDLFWARVDIKGVDECWEWQGARHPRGYGELTFKKHHTKAHRVAWELASGEIPAGFYACHKCDNPPCCNPNHLFLGSQKDNMVDCMRKARKPTKVTKEIVDLIRQRYRAEDITQRKLAAETGINYKAVSEIVSLRRWAWTDTTEVNEKCGPRTKLSNQQVIKIRETYSGGSMNNKQIATLYSVDISTISRITSGEKRRQVIENITM